MTGERLGTIGGSLRTARRGLTLLEVLVALATVSIAAVAWTSLLHQGVHAAEIARERDADVQRAAALLDRVSIWSGATLSVNLGRAPERGFMLSTFQVAPQLYEVAVSDTSNDAILLRTTFYRRGPALPDSSSVDAR